MGSRPESAPEGHGNRQTLRSPFRMTLTFASYTQLSSLIISGICSGAKMTRNEMWQRLNHLNMEQQLNNPWSAYSMDYFSNYAKWYL